MTQAAPVEVLPCDRSAAADIYGRFRYGATVAIQAMIRREIERGARDDDPIVQLLARHRLRHTPDREAMARVISPTAFQLADELARPGSEGFHEYRDAKAKADEQTAIALAKADAIIAMIEGGGA